MSCLCKQLRGFLCNTKTWTLRNSAYPDQTPQNVILSDQGLRCLLQLQKLRFKALVQDHFFTAHTKEKLDPLALPVLFLLFLMTNSICHSSLPRTVLEKVTLTNIRFRIHPRTKVDPVFQCVYISTPLKSCPYKSSATCA